MFCADEEEVREFRVFSEYREFQVFSEYSELRVVRAKRQRVASLERIAKIE